MKPLSGLPSALCLLAAALLLASGTACQRSSKKAKITNVAQDTMLLRDLAEANKNTASAAAIDNSLNTVRTTVDTGAARALPDLAAASRPTEIRNRPLASDSLTSPKTNEASKPATPTPSTQVAATSSSGDPCDSPDPTDQRSCLNRSIVQHDAELNRTYQDLLAQARKSGGNDLEERFRQSQREWINTRDSDCRQQTRGEDGTLWARARARCLAEYSAKRTSELQRNLNNLRGQ